MPSFRYLFFTVFIFCSNITFASDVKNITINGLDTISRGTVLNYLPIEIGDEYLDLKSNQILKALYDTKFFKNIDVKFDSGNSDLIINVIENPTIKYFEITGYDDGIVLNDEIISKIIDNSSLNTGKIFNKFSLAKLISELKSLYFSKGFYSSKFNEVLDQDNNNRIGIELKIDEGERSLIKSFDIFGNKYFKTEDLLNLFDIGTPDVFFINFFTKNDEFDSLAFEAGKEAILNKYVSSGFLGAKITNSKINFSNDLNGLAVSFEINEGQQYFVNGIEFSGELLNSKSDTLTKLIPLDIGSPIDKSKMILGVKNLSKYFADLGYAYNSIETKISDNDGKVVINYNVSLSNKVYVNRIIIEGNTRTRDSVIRREFKINEGAIYSKSDIDNSLNKIRRLGFFDNVSLQTVPLQSEDNVNLIIKVQEIKTGELSIGLSHSNATGPSVNFGIKERNILGTGNVLNAELINSNAVQNISLYFSDPYFNEDRHSINYGFFSKQLDASNLDLSNYKIDEVGLRAGYGIPINDTSRISANTSLASIDVACSSTFKSSGYEPVQCTSNDSIDFSTSISLTSNSLNDFYFPTKGTKSNFSGTVSLPFGDFKYYSIDSSFKKYSSISPSLTFKTNSSLNYASGYGNGYLPFYKRYFGGGSSSIRGFDFNSLGEKYANKDPKGGEVSVLGSVSVISTGDFVNMDNENIRLSGFLDAGGIYSKASDISFDDLRASSGLALTWLTPIGPIGLYAAKPLIKKSGDETKTFSFELGANF